jgi:hypothetical protein
MGLLSLLLLGTVPAAYADHSGYSGFPVRHWR